MAKLPMDGQPFHDEALATLRDIAGKEVPNAMQHEGREVHTAQEAAQEGQVAEHRMGIDWVAPDAHAFEGHKADTGKLRWHLLPWRCAAEVVRVFDYGCTKYGPDNWQLVPNARDRYYDALMRHVVAWRCGERDADDSRLHHLAHAAANCLILIWFDLFSGESHK